jgi:hypothetical protein
MAKPARPIEEGDQFDNWIAIEDSYYKTFSGHRRLVVRCQCQCPKKTIRLFKTFELTSPSSPGGSRGCRHCQVAKANKTRHPNPVLEGQTFGLWRTLADSYIPEDELGGRRVVPCLCECGTKREVLVQNLLEETSKCCGCITTVKPAQKGEQIENWKLLEDSHTEIYLGTLQSVAKAECQCVKKTVRTVPLYLLRNGKLKGCGCVPSKVHKPLKIGKKFNMLTVVRYSHNDDHGSHFYIFKCDCGNERCYPAASVTSGNSKSCSCLHREKASQRAVARLKNDSFLRWVYKGPAGRIIMRATWELAVAHRLDQAGVPWLYEPRWFVLEPGCRYLPDFYLLESDQWIEVKGREQPDWLRKKELFKQKHDLVVLDRSNIEDFVGLKLWKIYETYKTCKLPK